jgi:ribosomal protein S20
MDIKDLVLSSLEEIEGFDDEEVVKPKEELKEREEDNPLSKEKIQSSIKERVKEFNEEMSEEKIEEKSKTQEVEAKVLKEKSEKLIQKSQTDTEPSKSSNESEKVKILLKDIQKNREFLIDLRERLLVLFEGFNSKELKNVEDKVDLTQNFLQYLLAKIDDKLDTNS